MTSLHVICGLALSPIKNPGYAYVRGGGAFWAVPPPPQITACAFQARVNFCTSSTRGPANFCPKTGHYKRFFSVKLQDRSSERDQVV